MSEACGKREDVVASASVASVSYWVLTKLFVFDGLKAFLRNLQTPRLYGPRVLGAEKNSRTSGLKGSNLRGLLVLGANYSVSIA